MSTQQNRRPASAAMFNFGRQRTGAPDFARCAAKRSDGMLNRALLGMLLVGALGVGLGGWSMTAELAGAVIAPGQVVVDDSSKSVQHPGGGVVGEILVANGQRVTAGQVLIRLDGTQTLANYDVIAAKLLHLEAERARLTAERDRQPTLTIDRRLTAGDERARAIVERERQYFEARRRLIDGQKSRLDQRIVQIRREMAALDAQRLAKAREVGLIQRELSMVEDLNRRQLANMTRLTDMQRQLARFEGETAALAAQHARAEAQVHEVGLQILELEQRAMTDAHKELREVQARIEELVEREKAARDHKNRTELRSPVSGVVHELAVHTVGGVVRAGETVMKIVPENSALVVEARVAPSDIDHVAVGRRATLRLTALDQRTTPKVVGSVTHVGADATKDATNGRHFYTVRITIRDGELARIGHARLVPGMPVESFVETTPRTLFAYLAKPLMDNFSRALREP